MHFITRLSAISLAVSFVAPSISFAATTSYRGPDYSFSYSSDYQLEEIKIGNGEVIGQTIYSANRSLPPGALQIFNVTGELEGLLTESAAAEIARRSCDADGPFDSVSCPAVALSTPVLTSKFQGSRFLLREETEKPQTHVITRRVRGPIYVLSLRKTHKTLMVTYNHPIRQQRQHLIFLQRVLRSFVAE